MPTPETIRWLKTASLIVAAFGLTIALASYPATAGPTVFLADIIFWPVDGAQDFGARETRIMSAITGGVMVGWGVLLWLISAYGFGSDPMLARKAILASITTWFLVDSTGSFLAGAPLNSLFNVGFLLAFVLPLWRLPAPIRA